ncbi:MAG: universal stress protein [Candidatus Aramenus sp.]|nr:universal stress protein [Candidatus Aramenus sp.]
MYRRILVGYDGSKQAHKALETALALAKYFGAKVTVVEAVPHPLDSPETYVKEDVKTKEKIIRHKEEVELLGRTRGVKVEYKVIRGSPTLALSKVAEEENADLIVVGNRGIKGIKKLFVESVSSKVMESSRRSVLVVKD